MCDALVDRAMDAKCECVARVMQWVRSATARWWPGLPSVNVMTRSLNVDTRCMDAVFVVGY